MTDTANDQIGFDDAIAMLSAAPEEEQQQGQGEQPQEGAQEQPELSEEEKLLEELAKEEGEDGEQEQQEEEIPPPPNSWSKEDAEAWKALTPEAREVVQRREKERDRFVADLGRKAAEQRREVERTALEEVAKHADNYAAQLQAYLAQNMPSPPDQRLLYTGNPDDVLVYQRQDAAYRAGAAQQQELQQRIAQSQQQAEAARQQAMQTQTAAEAQRLQEVLPEFFDPEAGPKLRQSLESIGQELGYPLELMAQAGATDILALKTAAEWRDKAAKFDKIMAKRMETVRGAKQMPKVTRPGAVQPPVALREASAEREAAAIAQFQRDGSAEAAAALLMQRK